MSYFRLANYLRPMLWAANSSTLRDDIYKLFKDRSLFYSTFPIPEQAKKGSDWDFELSRVYTIALLDFDLKEEAFDEEKITHTVKLCDIDTNKVFYKKLDFIYVEIAKFKKAEDELETLYDKWLYVLKNLYKLEDRPKALRDKVFDRLFKEAEIATFTPEELGNMRTASRLTAISRTRLTRQKWKGVKRNLLKGLKKVVRTRRKKRSRGYWLLVLLSILLR